MVLHNTKSLYLRAISCVVLNAIFPKAVSDFPPSTNSVPRSTTTPRLSDSHLLIEPVEPAFQLQLIQLDLLRFLQFVVG